MVYYLVLCLVAMVSFTTIIGWRRVFRWDFSITAFYLLCFFLVFFLKPWYIFHSRLFKHFYQLGIPLPRGWWSWDELLLKLNLAIFLGLICFALAYRKCAATETERVEALPPQNWLPPVLKKRLVAMSLAFAAAGLLSIYYFCPLPGLRDVHVAEWMRLSDGSGYGFSNTTGYLVHASLFLIPSAVIFFLATQNTFFTLAMVTPFILFKLWWGWGRQGLIHLSISLILAAALVPRIGRRRSYLALFCAIGLLLGAAAVFGVLGEQRTALQSYVYKHTGPMTRYYQSTREEYVNALVGFEVSLHWLKYTPRVFPYQWGANYWYQLFILPIPRMLWPEKRNIFASYTPGGYVEDMSYLQGCAPGCIGDAWMNGGWLGIILIFGLTGALCALAQRAKSWRAYPVTGLLIFITTFPMAISTVRDGLGPLPPFIYFFGLPIAGTYLVERSWKKSIQSNSNQRLGKGNQGLGAEEDVAKGRFF